MRGVHSHQFVPRRANIGSSPHARGPLCRADNHAADAGIIPACAGSTLGKYSVPAVLEDHPRMRGVHLVA